MIRPRMIALVFAATFASAGAIFVAAPGVVVALFEWLGRATGMPGMPAADASAGLFRALAGAYMYVVTLLAWMTFRRPADAVWPALLAHAKLASAALSFLLFIVHDAFLVYLANGVFDGVIGVTALWMCREARRRS